jgi:hypothetical protein
MKKRVLSLGSFEKDNWSINATMYKNTILVYMYNIHSNKFFMQCLNDEHEASLFVEYILEKGEL